MKATGLSSKALQIGNKIGPLLGAAGGWLSAPRQYGGDMGGQLKWIVERLKNFKIADPVKTTTIALGDPNAYPIASGISLAMMGWGIQEIGEALGGAAGSTVKGLGRIAKNGGSALAINALVASYIYLAERNPHPMGSAGYGPGDRNTIDVDNPQILDITSAVHAPGIEVGMGINL